MPKTKKIGLHCLECDDKIYSRYRHDFVRCTCGAIFVDGGDDYFRSGWTEGKKYEQIEESEERKP